MSQTLTPEQEWARCRPWIEEALVYDLGAHTIDDVWDKIQRSEAAFWPGKASAMVTEVCEFPRLTALNFWLAGGDLTELVRDMRPVIEAWGAEKHGCTRFTVAGRQGWQRVMAQYGYRPAWSICMKDI